MSGDYSHNFTSVSQPNVYYNSNGQQQNVALRQALGHEVTQAQHQQPPVTNTSQLTAQESDNYFKVPAVIPRLTSVDDFSQPSIDAVIANVSSANSLIDAFEDKNTSSAVDSTVTGNSPQSPNDLASVEPMAKKAKMTPNKPATKQFKKVAKKTGMQNEEINDVNAVTKNSLNLHPNPAITESIIEQVVRSVNEYMVLEEDVKTGIMIYMENIVDNLVKETGRAANLRKSKYVQDKDVEFVLRSKFYSK